MKKSNLILSLEIALLVMLGIGAAGWALFKTIENDSKNRFEKNMAKRDGAIPVITQKIQKEPWYDRVQAIGTVQAREAVNITAKVSDIVEQVHFASGQPVAAGTLLVTLRHDAQQAALAQAQATFAEAQRLYQRQLELADQQLVARSTLDTQQALRDSAQARVQQLRAELDERQIYAPFSGVLGMRQISPGALLTVNTVITTLDDLEQVYVDFQVPEAMLAKLVIGNEVRASSIAWPDREFSGQLSAIDTRINTNSRTLTVRAEFANADHVLRPGMLLEVALLTPKHDAIILPEIAVIQEGQQSFVYEVILAPDDFSRMGPAYQVRRLEVRTGTRRKGYVEIVDGLVIDQRIVIEGMQRLRPNAFVRPTTIESIQECEASKQCKVVSAP